MAERMIPVNLLDDFTECSICTERFTDPRSLPCVHTFCLKCITKWISEKLPGNRLDCPLCRMSFEIPQIGIEGLPKNIIIAKLLAIKEAPGDTSTKVCGPYSAPRTTMGKKTNRAAAYCVDCRENQCGNCRHVHSRTDSSRTQRTVAVQEQFNTPETGLPSVCEKHPNNNLELYCLDCTEALYMVCFVTQHNGHESDEIAEFIESFRQDITENIVELQQTSRQKFTRALEYEQDRRRRLFSRLEVVEREVCARSEQLKATIERHKQQLLTEVRGMKIRKLKKIDNNVSEITQDETLVASFILYSEDLLKKGSYGDIAKESKNLKLTSTIMQQLCNKDRKNSLPDFTVTFTPSDDTSERDGGINKVGSLSVTGLSAKLCPTLEFWTTGEYPVSAVCYSNGQLFVTRNTEKEINVYDTTLTLRRRITASASSGFLQGLAACTRNNCLFVLDVDREMIYRIDLTTTDFSSANRWSVSKGPRQLSMNSSHNVLVTCYYAKKIQEYNTDGLLMREISDSNRLYHAIELSRGTIAVSRSGPVHGISLKSIDGEDIKTYGSTARGSGPGQMNEPRCLAVDSEGFIMVADERNNRILVLNAELTEARPLLLSRGVKLNWPLSFCYEESLGRLFVSEWAEPYRLFVYSNVFNLSSLFGQ